MTWFLLKYQGQFHLYSVLFYALPSKYTTTAHTPRLKESANVTYDEEETSHCLINIILTPSLIGYVFGTMVALNGVNGGTAGQETFSYDVKQSFTTVNTNAALVPHQQPRLCHTAPSQELIPFSLKLHKKAKLNSLSSPSHPRQDSNCPQIYQSYAFYMYASHPSLKNTSNTRWKAQTVYNFLHSSVTPALTSRYSPCWENIKIHPEENLASLHQVTGY